MSNDLSKRKRAIKGKRTETIKGTVRRVSIAPRGSEGSRCAAGSNDKFKTLKKKNLCSRGKRRGVCKKGDLSPAITSFIQKSGHQIARLLIAREIGSIQRWCGTEKGEGN